MRLKLANAVAAVLLVGATTAGAQGNQFNFVGSVRLVGNPPAALGGATNLVLDWLDLTLAPPASNQSGTNTGSITAVPTLSGAFSGISQASNAGTIRDLVITPVGLGGTYTGTIPPKPNTAVLVPGPVASFVTISGFTFNLTDTDPSPVAPGGFAFDGITVNPAGPNGSTATMAVHGTVTGPTFAGPRAFNGVFTAQFNNMDPATLAARIGAGTCCSSVSYSANFTAVPEPASIALVATGLLGLVGVARRRRSEA